MAKHDFNADSYECTDSGVFSMDYTSLSNSNTDSDGYSFNTVGNKPATESRLDRKSSSASLTKSLRSTSHTTSSQADPGFDSLDRSADHHSGAEVSGNSLSSDNVPKHVPQTRPGNSTSSGASTSSRDSGFCSESTTSGKQPNKPAEATLVSFTKVMEFYLALYERYPDPYTWTKASFGKDTARLTDGIVYTADKVLWSNSDDEDGDFEAINAARDRDEVAVMFALFMAKDAATLDTTNLDRQTVLHVAAELLDARLVRAFMTKGADGAVTDLWGNTPLHIASQLGRADVVKALTTKLARQELGHLRYKVPYRSLPQDNRDHMNNDGKAPVHLAAEGGHAEALRALAGARVDLDQRRLGDGYAALHIAVENGDGDSVRALLECGADVEVRNYRGETPLQLAFLCQRQDLVDLCIKHGAHPKQIDFARTEQVEFSSSDDEMDMEFSTDSDYLSRRVEQMAM